MPQLRTRSFTHPCLDGQWLQQRHRRSPFFLLILCTLLILTSKLHISCAVPESKSRSDSAKSRGAELDEAMIPSDDLRELLNFVSSGAGNSEQRMKVLQLVSQLDQSAFLESDQFPSAVNLFSLGDLTGIQVCSNLKILSFTAGDPQLSLEPLQALSELIHLEVIGTFKLSSIQLSSSTELRTLVLRNYIDRSNALRIPLDVKEIYLYDCTYSGVVDFSRCKSLEKIFIFGGSNIVDISFSANAPIEELIIRSTGISDTGFLDELRFSPRIIELP